MKDWADHGAICPRCGIYRNIEAEWLLGPRRVEVVRFECGHLAEAAPELEPEPYWPEHKAVAN